MLNNISWATYIFVAALTLLVYYVVVILLYYRPGIQQLFQGRNATSELFSFKKQEQQIAESDPELYPVVHLLMGELRQLIENLAQNSVLKEALIYDLHDKLSIHCNLTNTAFQPAINQFLKEECIKQCAIILEEEDLGELWK